MMRIVAADQLSADLAALKSAADRAGTALACLFSSSDEFEAELIRVRRAAGAYAPRRPRIRWGTGLALAGLSFVFLMM